MLAVATMASTTNTKFGFRHWSSQGDLRTEYWISSDSPNDRVAEEVINFTAGSLQTIHSSNSYGKHNNAAPGNGYTHRSRSAQFDSSVDLILALNGGHQHIRKSPGWKSLLVSPRRRKRHPANAPLLDPTPPSISSSDNSSPATSMSIETAHDIKTHRRQTSGLNGTPPEKKMSFFKRTVSSVTHRRQNSSLNLNNGSPPNGAQHYDIHQSDATQGDVTVSPSPLEDRKLRPQPRARNPEKPIPEPRSTTPVPKSALRRPSITTSGPSYTDRAENVQPTTPGIDADIDDDDSAVIMYPEGLNGIEARSSSKGIRFAEDTGSHLPTRPRRTSSAATHGRRSSIYSKAAEGDYIEGVDAGVGSKARRLSVMLPDELHVEECKLEDHFSLLQRRNKKEIGEGGAAVVRLMKSRTAGEPEDRIFAVKEFRPRDPEEEDEEEYTRKIKSEFAISKSCKHSNIVRTFRLCHSGEKWYHVMEYCELGDLNDLIQRGHFSQVDRNCMFKQLVRGLDYLHSRGIAHRDIKSENLLVSQDGCLKIADFGTGEVFCGKHPGVLNCEPLQRIDSHEDVRLCSPGWVGSRPYMAPEIFQRTGNYDPRAVDVWSAAIVYLTLCFGGNPWDCASPDCKNFNIYCGTWDDWLCKFPDGEIKEKRPLPSFARSKPFIQLENPPLIFGMLHPDPAHRWTIHDVLESKTVTDYECCQQEGYTDDIKRRQKKAMHNHAPPAEKKKFLSTHK